MAGRSKGCIVGFLLVMRLLMILDAHRPGIGRGHDGEQNDVTYVWNESIVVVVVVVVPYY